MFRTSERFADVIIGFPRSTYVTLTRLNQTQIQVSSPSSNRKQLYLSTLKIYQVSCGRVQQIRALSFLLLSLKSVSRTWNMKLNRGQKLVQQLSHLDRSRRKENAASAPEAVQL